MLCKALIRLLINPLTLVVALAPGSLAVVDVKAAGQASNKEAPGNPPQGLLPIPNYGGDPWKRSYLTGDWGGKRGELAKNGIQLGVESLAWMGSVVDGGLTSETESGINVTYKLKLDLMRAGILPGALIDIRAETRYGSNTNPHAGTVVPHFTPSLPPVDYADLQRDADFTITNLTYTQFLSEQFGVTVGKMDLFETGDPNEFASGRGRTQFQNYNLVFGTPTLLVPSSTLGIAAFYLPSKHVTLSSALLSATDCTYNSCVDDAYDNGTIWANAAMFQYRLGGLPGGANVNALYFFDADFTELGSLTIDPGDGIVGPVTSSDDESWIVVLSAWQYLSAKGAGEGALDLLNQRPDLEGWGVFGRLSFADDDTNPFKTSISFGIGGRGIFDSRPNDVFGIGYFYNDVFADRFTNRLNVEDHNQGAELFYNLAITPAAKLTIDLQYLGAGVKTVDDAIVLSGRLQMVF